MGEKDNQKQPKKESPISLVTRLITKKGPWEKKNLSLAIYWTKLILSIIVGLIVGIIRIQGAIGNLIYIAVPVVMQFYVSGALNVDVDRIFGNGNGVIFEGMLPCYFAFVLTWTITNTLFSSQ
ncbi:hypothetical protein GPJ56_009593 [Histomonas meleagridis]|uniref:uncharacterized protein n=1 Tax=Histomonas meleagridis TaxID=135588 RepID=UPI003559FD01|nr:hypothetical protein GPJ56_009593 [Histomonas meleagridis]KAH0799639.1 hypothetical protein GO595_007553 [Histomonas meleagridis]